MAKLSDSQQLLVTYVEQHFLLQKEIPSADIISIRTGMPSNTCSDLLKDEDCLEYLSLRGINVPVGHATPLEILTPKQLAVVNSLLDFNERKPDHKKLAALGVDSKTFQAWKSDPVFMNYFKSRVDNLIGDNTDEIDRALYDRARDGDINAIKYLNELTGRYRANEATDINFILVKIQETILRHVKDPETLEAIGRDLELLSRPTQVVIQPTRQRELSNGN